MQLLRNPVRPNLAKENWIFRENEILVSFGSILIAVLVHACADETLERDWEVPMAPNSSLNRPDSLLVNFFLFSFFIIFFNKYYKRELT